VAELFASDEASFYPGDAQFREDAEPLEDQALVELLQDCDEEAYEVLICRFQQPVYNLVFRLLSNRGDAGDVVQEVFLKIFRNIHTFRNQSSLKTWIYRIAVNEAHNQRRWFSRHKQQEVELEGDDGIRRSYYETLSDPSASPFDYVLGREKQSLIEQALEEMNPGFRTAVVLRDLEDLTYEEIAEILQISMGTVKSRILRGREALRRLLAERLEVPASCHLSPQPVE
jgi:RNA polymerase sigma-70 factor, ECF subfamily